MMTMTTTTSSQIGLSLPLLMTTRIATLVLVLLCLTISPSSSSLSSSPPSPSSRGASKVYHIPLTNFKNAIYYGELHVGNPRQTMKVLFATGSGDTWLSSTRCHTVGCAAHHLYNSTQSSTYVFTHREFNITYGIGQVHGMGGVEDMELLGTGGLSVGKVPFASITAQDTEFDNKFKWYPFDGIIGLSFVGASVSRSKPLFDRLMDDNAVDKNMFSLFLTQSPNTAGSALILGGTDSRYHLDDITFFPVEPPYVFWMIAISKVQLRESTSAVRSPLDRRTLVTVCHSNTTDENDVSVDPNGCRAVIDSGTSFVSGPSKEVEQLSTYLSVAEDCSNIEQLPVLTFQFYGKSYPLHPDDYVMRVPVRNTVACFLAITAYDFPAQMGPLWVLGNTFLRKYYTVYDRDANQIGFALARPI